MIGRRFGAALAAIALAAGIGSPAHADRVSDIGEIAERLESDSKPSPSTFPASSQAAAAMFEAANAIDRRYQPLLGMEQAREPASIDVAVLVAARDVLVAAYPDKAKEIADSFDFAIAESGGTAAERAAGARIGTEAARRARARVGLDPTRTLIDYRPLTTPGVYVSTTVPIFDPWMQAMRPWAMRSVDAVRPPPPPSLTSARYARDLNEVQALGRIDSKTRTPRQTMMANFRNLPDLSPTIRAVMDRPGRRTVDNARLLAQLWMAEYDQRLAMADAKMHYMFWRPLTAIRNADRDGNPATTRDAGWTPMLSTPNHPEYPCGHCGRAGAWAEVMKAEVGDRPEGGVLIKSLSLPDTLVMRIDSFDQWVGEVNDSRTFAGLHYRFSNEAGAKLGRDAARETLKLMQPLAPRN